MAEKELSDRAFIDRVVQCCNTADAHRAATAIPPDLSTDLASRILADFDATFAPRRSWFRRIQDAIWPGAPLWQPGFALALALICGLGLGLLPTLRTTTTDTSSLQQLTEVMPALDMAGDI